MDRGERGRDRGRKGMDRGERGRDMEIGRGTKD